MESMLTFVSVLFIVFGVLQIVLFFKVWRMTNDVADMRNRILNDPSKKDISKAIIGGNNNLAKKLIDERLVCELIEYSKGNSYKGYGSIDVIVEEYKLKYKSIGFDFPDNVIIDINEIKKYL